MVLDGMPHMCPGSSCFRTKDIPCSQSTKTNQCMADKLHHLFSCVAAQMRSVQCRPRWLRSARSGKDGVRKGLAVRRVGACAMGLTEKAAEWGIARAYDSVLQSVVVWAMLGRRVPPPVGGAYLCDMRIKKLVFQHVG